MCQNFVTVIVPETCPCDKHKLYVPIPKDYNKVFVVILCVITPTISLVSKMIPQ